MSSEKNIDMQSKHNRTLPKMTKLALLLVTVISFGLMLIIFNPSAEATVTIHPTWWPVQSIDTMKFSRDTSREFLDQPERARDIIEMQTSVIANTGATHVAIATPYDEEFLPIMRAWVDSARKHNLNVWFRGNWSGWEQWFGYSKITRSQHLQLTKDFITANPDLFAEGDIFSACPECENGGPGDPRLNGDVAGHRQFLIDEHQMMLETFRAINRNVRVNYNPMNGDVARLIMDKPTTQQLGGIVVIDHYVSTPEKLASDIEEIAKQSGGRVILGEFGAPIPDIHGNLSADQQAEWIESALIKIADLPQLIGVNYWTSFGGSTQIWDYDGNPRPAVKVLENYFKPKFIEGVVLSEFGRPISDASIISQERAESSNQDGIFYLPFINQKGNVIISASGYQDQVFSVEEIVQSSQNKILEVFLVVEKPTIFTYINRLWIKIISLF